MSNNNIIEISIVIDDNNTLTFKVKPSQYFFVESVTNNGQKCRKVYEDPETHICTAAPARPAARRSAGCPAAWRG